MTSNLGSLGTPRIGIALIWFLDGGEHQQGEPTAPAGPSAPPIPPATAAVTPEDIELVRGLTGLAPDELVTRLQAIAAGFERAPGVLRAEILRITGGDEVTAEHLMQLIRASTPGGDERGAEGDDDGGDAADAGHGGHTNQDAERVPGRVIHLPLRAPGSDDDDGGNA